MLKEHLLRVIHHCDALLVPGIPYLPTPLPSTCTCNSPWSHGRGSALSLSLSLFLSLSRVLSLSLPLSPGFPLSPSLSLSPAFFLSELERLVTCCPPLVKLIDSGLVDSLSLSLSPSPLSGASLSLSRAQARTGCDALLAPATVSHIFAHPYPERERAILANAHPPHHFRYTLFFGGGWHEFVVYLRIVQCTRCFTTVGLSQIRAPSLLVRPHPIVSFHVVWRDFAQPY